MGRQGRDEGAAPTTSESATGPVPASAGVTVGGCALHERLGQGGMGTVYRATQLALGRQVAVKVVPATGVSDDLVARFKREARTAAALEHPHSIPIYAAGEEDGLLYLVMRLVDGPDLGILIAREGPLAPERAVALIGQVAGALDAAHAAGLVHRDVKPANILVEPRPTGEHAYLSDFGLMRHAVGDTAITRVGEWVGSVDYVAPEQIDGRTIDGRADVYALAGVLYTALTGAAPFARANPTLTARAHRDEPPPAVASAAMSAVIARGMAKAPYDRFASASDLVRGATAALSAHADATPAAHRSGPPRPAPPPGDLAPTTPTPRRAPAAPPSRRRRAPGRSATLGLLALLVVAGGAVAVALATRSGARAHTSSTVVSAPPASGPRFTGDGFSFTYPTGWQVVESQRSTGAFIRTRIVEPSGAQVLIVDRVLNDPMSVTTRAINVSQSTAQRGGGYQEISLAPATIAGRNAFTWAFELVGQTLPQRYDVFVKLGTSGYAVLAEGSDARAVSRVALAAASSLQGS